MSSSTRRRSLGYCFGECVGFSRERLSFYRDTYLKSDAWAAKRVHLLRRRGLRCELCDDVTSLSNDVHHLHYGSLSEVGKQHVRILCRPCHTRVHKFTDRYPLLASVTFSTRWKLIVNGLNTGELDTRAAMRFCFSAFKNKFHKTRPALSKPIKWDNVYCDVFKDRVTAPSNDEWLGVVKRYHPEQFLQRTESSGPRRDNPLFVAFVDARRKLFEGGVILSQGQMKWNAAMLKWAKTAWSPREWYDLAVILRCDGTDWPCGEH